MVTFYSAISIIFGSMFFVGIFDINDAFAAYANVLRFSSKYLSEGLKQAT